MNRPTANREKITLGAGERVRSSYCYCVSETPEGQLLVGRKGGFDIISSDGEVVRSVSVPTGDIHSAQYYDGCLYALHYESTKRLRQVIVFDSENYSEQRRWSRPYSWHAPSIAVSNDKVYVSDPDRGFLCVCSLTGTNTINHYSRTYKTPMQLSVSEPDCIIISDYSANIVKKLNCRTEKMVCLYDGPERHGDQCCDDDGNVWVWLCESRSLSVLSSGSGWYTIVTRSCKYNILG